MNELPFESVIFDLDGVITKTALVHAKAWKKAFDEYLKLREERDAEPFKEFTHENDYLPYVDGKPRYEGVQSFLESRGINIGFGDPSDEPGKETICGIGNKKNSAFVEVLDSEGVQVYESTVAFVKALHQAGIKTGVASSSKNCQKILQTAGIEELFETRVDGVVSAELGLKGKPEGDIFVRAAKNIGCRPETSVVVEDATSGVAAGRNGGFGFVLGVARENNEEDLAKHGADIVVSDMCKIDIEKITKWFSRTPVCLSEKWEDNKGNVQGIENENDGKDFLLVNPCYDRPAKVAFSKDKDIVFFLDYDGTLSPIVERPEDAIITEEMRKTVTQLSRKCLVAIVSGRMREDVENLAQIPNIFYAGSHGYDIKGPDFSMIQPQAKEIIPVIDELISQFKKELGGIEGVQIEEKKFSVAVHYRRLKDETKFPEIEAAVKQAVQKDKRLRLMSGKKVFEILPDIEWDKSKAIRWIMETLDLSWDTHSIIYMGDDTTDEYAFRYFRTRATGVLVSEKPKPSAADFRVDSTEKLRGLFEQIL